MNPSTLLAIVHLVGLCIGVGAATVKLTLLTRCKIDPSYVPAFLKVSKHVTRHIILGLALMTVSGIVWLFLGYPFNAQLAVKSALVAAIWVLGPLIDNVVEPKFVRLAPAPGATPSPEFAAAMKQYLVFEYAATLLFYAVILMWVRK